MPVCSHLLYTLHPSSHLVELVAKFYYFVHCL